MNVATRRGALALIAATLVAGATLGAAQAEVVIIERPMPAPLVEVVPAAPHPGYGWVPGHYAWRFNHWQWIRGHYFRGEVVPMPAAIVETPPPPPSPRHFWVRGHYVWEGRAWAWHSGHWVR